MANDYVTFHYLHENFIISLCMYRWKEEDMANDYVTFHYLHENFIISLCMYRWKEGIMANDYVTLGCLDENFIISLCINEKRACQQGGVVMSGNWPTLNYSKKPAHSHQLCSAYLSFWGWESNLISQGSSLRSLYVWQEGRGPPMRLIGKGELLRLTLGEHSNIWPYPVCTTIRVSWPITKHRPIIKHRYSARGPIPQHSYVISWGKGFLVDSSQPSAIPYLLTFFPNYRG
jgi:hypothetical protein